jgi:hypothetical protein
MGPFRKRARSFDNLAKSSGASATDRGLAARWTYPNLMTKRARHGRLCPMARHALSVAPPHAVRARLVMRLGALHRREEARLVAAARAYRIGAVLDRGLVRAQLLDERVAPGGGERVEPKARADAQVFARNRRVGRAVLARDVLDQARAPSHGVHAPLPHGEAKGVDARRLLGPVGVGVIIVVVVAVVMLRNSIQHC